MGRPCKMLGGYLCILPYLPCEGDMLLASLQASWWGKERHLTLAMQSADDARGSSSSALCWPLASSAPQAALTPPCAGPVAQAYTLSSPMKTRMRQAASTGWSRRDDASAAVYGSAASASGRRDLAPGCSCARRRACTRDPARGLRYPARLALSGIGSGDHIVDDSRRIGDKLLQESADCPTEVSDGDQLLIGGRGTWATRRVTRTTPARHSP